MKPAYQPTKQISEQLLKQILDENMMLNSMENSMIGQIIQVFKIQENAMMDRIIKLGKIKQKLLDIIVDQKEECVNYLTLPKFKNVSDPSKKLLKDAMALTWSNYLKRSTQDQKSKNYEKYLCRTENLKQAQQFHMGLFHFLKSCYFFDHPYYSRPMGNFPGMIPTNDPYSYPGMPLVNDFYPVPSNNGSNVKVEDTKGGMIQSYNDTRQLNNKQKERQRERQKEKEYKQLKKMKDKQRRSANDKDSEMYKPENEKVRKKQPKNKSQKQPSNSPIYKAFASCFCKGKKSENQRYFDCQECEKKFHLMCLNIPNNAVERPNVKKICPQCSLQNTNSMYKVIQNLEAFWAEDKELSGKKLKVNSKRNKEIVEKKYCLQFRFTKIQGRSMFYWETDKKSESIIKQQAEKEVAPKQILNEIIIKDEVLGKGDGEDVKISLDCMKGTQTSYRTDKKSVILYVVLNIVQPKTFEQIISAKYEYFQDNYLDKFFTPMKDQIKIQIIDTGYKLLTIPVRGSDCQHPDVYNLSQLVSHFLDFHTQNCFCCSKKCKTFKIDRKVQEEIKKIKSQITDETQYPSIIYYQRDGTFRWQNPKQKPPGEGAGDYPGPFFGGDSDDDGEMSDQNSQSSQKHDKQKEKIENQNDSEMLD